MICYLLFFLICPCTCALLSGVVTITILRMTQNHAASKTIVTAKTLHCNYRDKTKVPICLFNNKPPRQHRHRNPPYELELVVVATLSSSGGGGVEDSPCLT
ncbi:hypothetical protein FALCPG4_009551 [Fusarium falciforme]